jgi:uncharacterized protein (TIGR02271 family)
VAFNSPHSSDPVAADTDRHLGSDATEMVRSEEELSVDTRLRSYGTARLTKTIELEEVERLIPVHADFLETHEIDVADPDSDSGQVEHAANGDISVPVFEERLVVEKRLVVAKRVVLSRERRVIGEQQVRDVLRRERIEVNASRHPDAVERDAGLLAGEDLSLGPTPLTRHPDGARDDVRDTTQGPTPEIRRAIRMEEGLDGTAAGEPGRDPRTRAAGGGTQDRVASPDTDTHTVEPDREVDLVEIHEPAEAAHSAPASPLTHPTKES